MLKAMAVLELTTLLRRRRMRLALPKMAPLAVPPKPVAALPPPAAPAPAAKPTPTAKPG